MLVEVQAFLDQYQKWLRERTTFREVNDWVEITTPYRLKDYQTPYEKLTSLPDTSLPDWEELLKPGVTKERLDQQARRLSDTEAARQMSDRKAQLLARFRSVAGFGVYPVSGEPS